MAQTGLVSVSLYLRDNGFNKTTVYHSYISYKINFSKVKARQMKGITRKQQNIQFPLFDIYTSNSSMTIRLLNLLSSVTVMPMQQKSVLGKKIS